MDGLGPLVVLQEFLEGRIAQQLHRPGEVALEGGGQPGGIFGDVAFRNPFGELLPRVAAHVLFDTPQAFHQHVDVVGAVHVLPDVLDHLRQGNRIAAGRFDLEVRGVLEIVDQRAVEAVEDRKVALVDGFALARAPPQHLLPQDAGLHRAQEHDELQRRDVHARGEHVHRHHHLGIRPVAEFPDALQRAVHAGTPRDLLHEPVALVEDLPADAHQLVGVRHVRQVVHREDQDLREAPRLRLVPVGVLGDFLDDLLVAVGHRDGPLDLFGREGAVVLEVVQNLRAGRGIDHPHQFALFQERAVHAHPGGDLDGLVLDQEAVPDGLIDAVAIDGIAEHRHRVRGGRGRQPHLHRVEMPDGVAPQADVAGGVAAVAFIGDDQVEGVDRDVEPVGVVFHVRIARRLLEGVLPPEQVDRHPLDGRDIDERMAGLWIGQIAVGQQLGVERVVVAKIILLEALAVDLVFLGELVALRRVEGRELPHGLGGQRLAVHQEQDALGQPRFQHPVDGGHRGEGLARPRRHGHEDLPLAVHQVGLHRRDAVGLVAPQPGDLLHRGVEQPFPRRTQAAAEELLHRVRRMEMAQVAGHPLGIARVEEPDDLAVRGIEERNPQAVPEPGTVRGPGGIALGLLQHVLGIDPDLLGLDDPQQLPVHEKRVVRRAVLGRVLRHGDPVELAGIQALPERHDLPRRPHVAQPRIDPLLPCLPFQFGHSGPWGTRTYKSARL